MELKRFQTDVIKDVGEDFKDHIFRFQILDETRDHGHDWKDALTEILSAES